METPESALALLLLHTVPHGRTETVPLSVALGRVTACAVQAPIALPPFDRSPLDGFTYAAADTVSATADDPIALEIIGELCAGSDEVFSPCSGQAVRIMTGAPIPKGCDCVIRQESVQEKDGFVYISEALRSEQNICYAGEDIPADAPILEAGQRLHAAHIGVLGSLGISSVSVYEPVKVALLCTGDELIEAGQPLTRGKIYNANQAMFSARLEELGIDCRILHTTGDDAAAATQSIQESLAWADMVLTTGGVSVGKKDILHDVYQLLQAKRLFWRISMKPGSPMLAGLVNNKIILSLSGNPFAAIACFELFAKPVLSQLSGDSQSCNRRIKVPLAGGSRKLHPARRMIRAHFDGVHVWVVEGNHSSGSLSSMMGCNCFIDVTPDCHELRENELVQVILF